MGLEPWATVVSAAIALVALIGTWVSWRRSELRREDVLAWALEAVSNLQTLHLICLDEEASKGRAPNKRLEDVRFRTSVLVEQGRLFFRNAQPRAFGTHKEPAYRGYRPCILDHLVVAHQVATAWTQADARDRRALRVIAEDCLKKFVSLAQVEVGRDRTASADAARGGDGAHLRSLMKKVDRTRLLTAAERREQEERERCLSN